MVEARPEIHRNRANLDFHPDETLLIRKIDRYLRNDVIGAIAVILRIPNIILNLQDMHIVLPHHHTGERVNIVHEGADNTHTRNVIEILRHRL